MHSACRKGSTWFGRGELGRRTTSSSMTSVRGSPSVAVGWAMTVARHMSALNVWAYRSPTFVST